MFEHQGKNMVAAERKGNEIKYGYQSKHKNVGGKR